MRKFTKIALGTVGVIAGISIIANAGGGESAPAPAAAAAPSVATSTPAVPSVPAPASSAPAEQPVAEQDGDVYTYEVFSEGKGTAMSVTYVKDDKMNMQQHTSAKLPFKVEVSMDGWAFKPLSINAQAGPGMDSISCRISRGDEVLVENTSTGAYAMVMCNG